MRMLDYNYRRRWADSAQGGRLATWNVVYERTSNGWSAFVPEVGVSVEGPTLEEIDKHIKSQLIADEGRPAADGMESVSFRRVDRPFRIKVFTNKIDWLGPALVLLSAWYFSAQVLVAWVFEPPYNLFTNAISDLGATGHFQKNYPFYSPRWIWMDLSFGVLGAAMLIGSILVFTEFRFSGEGRERVVAAIGFFLLSVSGLGAILVGCVPENLSASEFGLHGAGTFISIGAGQLGILILGLVLRSIPDWLREYMIVTSLIVFLGGISYKYYSTHAFGFGAGALERVVQYPQGLWLILFGFYISREHWRTQVTGSRFRFTGHRSPEKGALLWALRSGRSKP
jgi:hypothetical membrane protein